MNISYAPGSLSPEQLETYRQQAEAARRQYERANALLVPFIELCHDLFGEWQEAQLAYELARRGVVRLTEEERLAQVVADHEARLAGLRLRNSEAPDSLVGES